MTKSNRPYKRIAFSLSLILMMIWIMLGTSSTIAWFKDTSNELKNVFHLGEFDLVVSYKEDSGDYKKIEQDTVVFNEDDLYEPGYTKVQYFKVENKGTVAFDFDVALQVTSFVQATNALGELFNLQDYIRFGVVYADTETELDSLTGMPDTRSAAIAYANDPLNQYASPAQYQTEKLSLDAKHTKYMALIIRMPEEVGNEANYRLQPEPKVTFGLFFTASQKKDNP